MADKSVCFAKGRPGEWEAICLDYDIAVQGRSFEEVEKFLSEAIDDYVESAEAGRTRCTRQTAPSSSANSHMAAAFHQFLLA